MEARNDKVLGQSGERGCSQDPIGGLRALCSPLDSRACSQLPQRPVGRTLQSPVVWRLTVRRETRKAGLSSQAKGSHITSGFT